MKKFIVVFLKIIFFLGIGVFFIWFFIKDLTENDKKNIIESLKNANYFWIVISVLIGLASHLFRTLRWRILFEPMGHKPGILNTFFAVMTGYLANLALPRLGEITRCGILKKYNGISFTNALGTVIAERALDILTFLVLFVINILIQFQSIKSYIYDNIYLPLINKFHNNNYTIILLLIGCLLILTLIIFILNKKYSKNKFFIKIKGFFTGLWNGLKSLSQIKKPFAFILYTFLLWLAYFLTLYVCTFSIPETSGLTPLASFSVLVFGTIGMMIVQGGIGIYPAIAAETLILYNIASIHGYTLGWLAWLSQTVTIIIFGIIALIFLPVVNKKKYSQNVTS